MSPDEPDEDARWSPDPDSTETWPVTLLLDGLGRIIGQASTSPASPGGPATMNRAGGVMLRILAAAVIAAGCLDCGRAPTAAPFSWSGLEWCPAYFGACAVPVRSQQYTVSFSPAQVSVSGGWLALSLSGGVSGAVNTQGHEAFYAGTRVSVVVTLPCKAGQLENWPAVWLTGPEGTWPRTGEIDIMEGLHGSVAWHYQYLDAAGQHARTGGTVPGDWCGTHTYAADWRPGKITWYYDGKQVAQITAARTGVPLAAGPMYLVIDYGQGPYGGPDVSPARMVVSSVSAAGGSRPL